MNELFETRLIECLDALESGAPDAAEAVLARYPDDAVALRQALGVAAALSLLDAELPAGAQQRSRQKFLAGAAAMTAEKTPRPGSRHVVLRAALMLGLILAAGAIPVAASGNALPGDPLYGIKRQVEGVELGLAPSDAARTALARRNNSRRVEEIGRLLAGGRTAQTAFGGTLNAATRSALVVDGRSISIPPGMKLPDLTVGSVVEVTVQIQGGKLILVSITPISQPEILTATTTPVPTAVQTDTPRPEASKTAESHETPEARPTEDAHATEGPHETEHAGGEGGGETVEPTEDGGTSGSDDGTDSSGGGDGSGGSDDSGGSGGHGGGGDDGGG